MNDQIKLDGVWQLRWDDGERGDRIGCVLKGGADWSRAWNAQVPGTVHETLLKEGVISDPNKGANILTSRWVEETMWHYRRKFHATRLRKGERAWLLFEGLDLAATIYLNGTEVGQHANAFYPCRLDVTEQLKSGENTLVVRVESGLFYAANRSADGYRLNFHHQFTKRVWLRKTQSEHGWDWSPRFLNVGIPGSVSLEIADGVRWENLVVLSDLSEDHSKGTVKARLFAEGLGSKPVRGTLIATVVGTGCEERMEVTIQPGMNQWDAVMHVKKPVLWWPVGHGAQKLYQVKVSFRVGGKVVGAASKRIGFRRVRVNQEPHPERGRYCIIEINGKPIFCKGGNWVPADLILNAVDRPRYVELLDLALEGNCNFMRVWGGGLYESDDFYELCDEKGILVWQEFVFACGKYPSTDEQFLADFKREATHQIRRLAHHVSLIVWCGNNEMEWGNHNWGYEKGVAHPDYAIFHLVIPQLLKKENPGRYYQPSSPFSPDNESPNADDLGDQHPWSIGFGNTDFRQYRNMICRLPNEGGLLGPTSLPTVRASLAGGPEKIGSFAWELHDNSVSYWDWTERAYPPDYMIEQWTGRSVRGMSVADYVYWGGVVQGAGLAEYIKNFRRRMFDSASAVFWMYNDVWPCVRSWTMVDYYRRRTPAFWPVRRAFAPVTVVVTREENTVRVYGVNEGPARSGTLRYGLMRLAGPYPFDTTLSVTLPENASTVLAEFPTRAWDALGSKKHVAFAILSDESGEVARDTLILEMFKDMQWPISPKVRVTLRQGKAIFTSSTFAWRVCLDLDGERPFPDNFFDIYPGIPTVLDWPVRLGKPKILRVGNARG